jgi:hypothetical protein
MSHESSTTVRLRALFVEIRALSPLLSQFAGLGGPIIEWV